MGLQELSYHNRISLYRQKKSEPVGYPIGSVLALTYFPGPSPGKYRRH